MTDSPHQTDPQVPAHTGVLLLAPEIFATPPDPVTLHASLIRAYPRVRLLVRPATPADMALAETLARAGVAVEVLLPGGIDAPPTNLTVARMPPGSSTTDTDELALALSDGLLLEGSPLDRPLVRLARRLEKPFFPLENTPPLTGSRHVVSHRLDPEQPGWHSWLRPVSGRLEQFAIELCAFNWQGLDHGGIAASGEELRACLPGRAWTHTPRFAPPEWKGLALDSAALEENSPIVANFNRLDRSATHGARVHRDLAWSAYGAAAFAVLFAVAGHIDLFPFSREVWAAGEFVVLFFIVAATAASRLSKLKERWTACRFGAEQLRIARMCLPLLVVPSALCSIDAPAKKDHSRQALAEVKRAVRDQGLPRVPATASPIDAARWLELVVAGQVRYHHKNHRKLRCAEERLTWLAEALFFASFAAVCLHPWLGESRYLLIFTAAGPAFGSAVHGIATRLGFVDRIDLSRGAESELAEVQKELQDALAGPGAPQIAWTTVRKLAFRAAEAMGRETTSWHSQVRRQKDELP